MRAKVLLVTAFLMVGLAGLGCGKPHYVDYWQYEQDRRANEQRITRMETSRMSRREMDQLAEVVAEKVVQRLKQEQTESNDSK
ncbi:MAG: hypothetical protein ACYTBJ_04985 [Planctomycetota bacterium]|jgi:hypothetical protein